MAQIQHDIPSATQADIDRLTRFSARVDVLTDDYLEQSDTSQYSDSEQFIAHLRAALFIAMGDGQPADPDVFDILRCVFNEAIYDIAYDTQVEHVIREAWCTEALPFAENPFCPELYAFLRARLLLGDCCPESDVFGPLESRVTDAEFHDIFPDGNGSGFDLDELSEILSPDIELADSISADVESYAELNGARRHPEEDHRIARDDGIDADLDRAIMGYGRPFVGRIGAYPDWIVFIDELSRWCVWCDFQDDSGGIPRDSDGIVSKRLRGVRRRCVGRKTPHGRQAALQAPQVQHDRQQPALRRQGHAQPPHVL
ncbi:MAG: hypothetical protein Q4Q58_07275 [Thermoplasmata archaeon]|nr:hypothetical protein [Thermoplasmata archaeon]